MAPGRCGSTGHDRSTRDGLGVSGRGHGYSACATTALSTHENQTHSRGASGTRESVSARHRLSTLWRLGRQAKSRGNHMSRTRPEWRRDRDITVFALLLYAGSVPFDLFTLVGGRTLPFFTGLVLVCTWGAHRLKRRPEYPVPRAVFWTSYVLLTWAVATGWRTPPGTSTTAATLSLAFNVVVFWVLCETLPRCWRAACWALTVGASVVALVLLVVPVREVYDRAQIGDADENLTAFILTVALAGCAAIAMRSSGRHSAIVALGLGAIVALGALRTGSRTGLAAVAAMVVWVAFWGSLRGTGRQRLVAVALAGGAAIALPRLLSSNLLPSRLATFARNPQVSDNARQQINELFYQHLDDWAVLGIGYGADADFLTWKENLYINAHGSIMKTWIEMGIIGLVLLTGLVAVIVVRGVHSSGCFEAVLFLLPVAAFSLTLGGLGVAVFWFALALVLTAAAASRRIEPDSVVPSVQGGAIRV